MAKPIPGIILPTIVVHIIFFPAKIFQCFYSIGRTEIEICQIFFTSLVVA